jgi:hypothetical protein
MRVCVCVCVPVNQDIESREQYAIISGPLLMNNETTFGSKKSRLVMTACGSLDPMTACGSLDPMTACGSLDPMTACGSLDPMTACGSLDPMTACGSLDPMNKKSSSSCSVMNRETITSFFFLTPFFL